MDVLQITAPPGTQMIRYERAFAAARTDVFRCLVEPDLVPLWWARTGHTTVVRECDPRNGGAWSVALLDDFGNRSTFRGVFHTVEPNRLIIQTFESEARGDVALISTLLSDTESGSRLERVIVYASVGARDEWMGDGAVEAAREMFQRLEQAAAALGR